MAPLIRYPAGGIKPIVRLLNSRVDPRVLRMVQLTMVATVRGNACHDSSHGHQSFQFSSSHTFVDVLGTTFDIDNSLNILPGKNAMYIGKCIYIVHRNEKHYENSECRDQRCFVLHITYSIEDTIHSIANRKAINPFCSRQVLQLTGT